MCPTADIVRVAVGWLPLEELNTEFIGHLVNTALRQEIYMGVPVWHINREDWIWMCLLWPKDAGRMYVVVDQEYTDRGQS